MALLEAQGIHKRFGGARALDGASLEVVRGEVHGLLGENGSGKSTLLGVLAGRLRQDRGEVRLDGRVLAPRHPSEAIASGIVTVSQETALVPELSVVENVLLGHRMVRSWRGIDWRATRRRAIELLERLHFPIDPDSRAVDLRPEERQIVEIARALSMDARVLLLDEPTSSLTDENVARLFETVRGLRADGVSTIFVSHRMKEVFDLVDRLTILRNGRTVDTGPIEEYDTRRVIRSMTGQEVDLEEKRAAESGSVSGTPRLRVRDLRSRDLNGISLDVHAGEVIGLAGLVGAGRSRLLESLFGLGGELGGEVEIDGSPVRISSPGRAMAAGVAYVPADRKLRGLCLHMDVTENLMMARTARRRRVARPRRGDERRILGTMTERLGIVGSTAGAPIRTLSGGNQQKVLLGKWLGTEPRILLLDEPTRGVDIGAKEQIHRLLDDVRESGLAVLVSSSDSEELMRLCDSVHVLFRGRIAATLTRESVSDASITHYATGHS